MDGYHTHTLQVTREKSKAQHCYFSWANPILYCDLYYPLIGTPPSYPIYFLFFKLEQLNRSALTYLFTSISIFNTLSMNLCTYLKSIRYSNKVNTNSSFIVDELKPFKTDLICHLSVICGCKQSYMYINKFMALSKLLHKHVIKYLCEIPPRSL